MGGPADRFIVPLCVTVITLVLVVSVRDNVLAVNGELPFYLVFVSYR